jgi:hypothetical protein
MFDCSLAYWRQCYCRFIFYILYCANETIPYLRKGTAKALILTFFHSKVKNPNVVKNEYTTI